MITFPVNDSAGDKHMGLPVSMARLKHSLQILLSFRAEAIVPERTEAGNQSSPRISLQDWLASQFSFKPMGTKLETELPSQNGIGGKMENHFYKL